MYIGFTNNLQRRMREHKESLIDGFTKKYHVNKLVYFEKYSEVSQAIKREKQLKSLLRIKKNILVESMNPSWEDLSTHIFRHSD